MFCFSCGDKVEITRAYYENGKVQGEVEMFNGKKNGKQITYYETGKIESESFWKDDLAEGVSKKFYPSGSIKSISSWKEGIQDGSYKLYHDNGDLNEEGQYLNGMLHGPVRIYYQGNKLMRLENYKNGIKHGFQYAYYQSGDFTQVSYYLDFRGKETLVKYINYDESGNVEEGSMFYFKSNSDTIKLDETFSLEVKLENPRFKNMRLVVGDYDEHFSSVDSLSIDTVNTQGMVLEYKKKPKKVGQNYVRGYLDNFKEEISENGVPKVTMSHSYFEYPFYVTLSQE